MTKEQADSIVKLLQVFWPIEWSQRMSHQHEEILANELATMFKDYDGTDVAEAIRYLARSEERPPTYKKVFETIRKTKGSGDDMGFRYAQYVYQVFRDKKGREYVKQCTVKIFPDGNVEIPKGIPKVHRMLRKMDIIDEDGKGIYDLEAHLQKWGPVWKERQRLVYEEGMSPKEAIKKVRPETMAETNEPYINDGSVPEGFQQMIDGFLPDF